VSYLKRKSTQIPLQTELLPLTLFQPGDRLVSARTLMTNYAAPCHLIAVYGTLRRRSIFHKLPWAPARLQFFGSGLIKGRLFWQRTYPALIQDRGIARAELFWILNPSVLTDLDRYEGFDPGNAKASLFIRTQVLLLNPQVRAWVYFLNQKPRGTQTAEIENSSNCRVKERNNNRR
jgi:gamma-glutamylcyclotransferase (GGCT)/AIG2-like uncharacterized protein YtfP